MPNKHEPSVRSKSEKECKGGGAGEAEKANQQGSEGVVEGRQAGKKYCYEIWIEEENARMMKKDEEVKERTAVYFGRKDLAYLSLYLWQYQEFI